MSESSNNNKNYEIENIKQLIRRPEIWVRELTVLTGQEVPWHQHTNVQDYCYGLKGIVLVEMLDSAGNYSKSCLIAGASCVLPPGTPHRLTCAEGDQATYLLIQDGSYDFVKLSPPVSR